MSKDPDPDEVFPVDEDEVLPRPDDRPDEVLPRPEERPDEVFEVLPRPDDEEFVLPPILLMPWYEVLV